VTGRPMDGGCGGGGLPGVFKLENGGFEAVGGRTGTVSEGDGVCFWRIAFSAFGGNTKHLIDLIWRAYWAARTCAEWVYCDQSLRNGRRPIAL
jgi:hypothetical protein